jgi:DNA-binding MarR family transcriptional regulator
VRFLAGKTPTVEEAIHVASFRVALRHFFRATEVAARESGLTPRQYLLLLLIKGAPDGSEHTTVGALCKRLYLAQSTVTELVRRAEQAGLVRASQSQRDGRVSEIRLTPAGERRLAECFSRLEDERRALSEALSEHEIAAVL